MTFAVVDALRNTVRNDEVRLAEQISVELLFAMIV